MATATETDTAKKQTIDIETRPASDDDAGPKRTQSVTTDANGNTVVVKEDGETFVIDKKAERALLWKFDLRILPLLTMMYLFNALDKANLGNAKTDGLEKDLGFAGTNKCIISAQHSFNTMLLSIAAR